MKELSLPRRGLLGGHRARGLSLLEVLIAFSLLGGAVLVVLGLFPAAYSSLIQARDTTAAVNLARAVLESTRSTPFSSLTAATNVSVDLISQVNGANVITQCFYDLNLVASSPTPDLYYEASVVVRWSSGSVPGSGTRHVIQMDTVIENR